MALVFWAVLTVAGLTMVFFVPNYFKDETAFLVRHAQGETAAIERQNQADPVLIKLRNGTPLTLEDRKTLLELEDQEEAVERLRPMAVSKAFKLTDGLGNKEIELPITPGRYTCRAELTAKDPVDLAVTIGGIGVDLATTAYVNGQACNGQKEVSFGPDGKAILHWNLDDDVKATVKGVTRWVKITFTPA